MLKEVGPIQLPLSIQTEDIVLTNLTTFSVEHANEEKITFAKKCLSGELARNASILDVAKGMTGLMEEEYGGVW